MRVKIICIIFILIFVATGCSRGSNSEVTPSAIAGMTPSPSNTAKPPEQGKGDIKSISTGYTDFGFNLFSEIAKKSNGKNIFISPASVAFALSMTVNGAKGSTKDAMTDVLRYRNISLEEINKGNKLLMEELQKPGSKVELSIANSLWCRPDIKFKKDFIGRCKDFYSAEASNNFKADAINSWVKEKTKNKIGQIIDKIPADAILYLINAIYFKGTWKYEFDKKKTEDKDFYFLDGNIKKYPIMSQRGKFNYYRGESFQAVSLPYGDGSTSMYIFLTDDKKGLTEFQKNLNGKNWEEWMKSFQMKEGDILLPRFKIEYELLLNDALKALGMTIAFDRGGANFSDMCEIPSNANVFINRVIHKTFVEVNEEGTEAAAVTAVEMGIEVTSADPKPPPERFYMLVDHPFFFVIRDNKTGLILFMGSIVEPK